MIIRDLVCVVIPLLEAIRNKGIDTKVRTVLRNMKLALRHVVGSEGEREFLWLKSVALRFWNGCSIVFFTLNLNDIWSPLLVVFFPMGKHGSVRRSHWIGETRTCDSSTRKPKWAILYSSTSSRRKTRVQLRRLCIERFA